jgi:hypothetical protein
MPGKLREHTPLVQAMTQVCKIRCTGCRSREDQCLEIPVNFTISGRCESRCVQALLDSGTGDHFRCYSWNLAMPN